MRLLRYLVIHPYVYSYRSARRDGYPLRWALRWTWRDFRAAVRGVPALWVETRGGGR